MKSVFDTLATAVGKGIAIVRSSRIFSGVAIQDAEGDDANYGLTAGTLSAQKFWVLLQLALTQTRKPTQILACFDSL